jgi:transcriptional regulator with XRE-family HTH domain
MSTQAEVSGVSDLSRRILRRREELGLTSEEVARRAGVDPSYLDYFERNPVAVLSSTAMLRLA